MADTGPKFTSDQVNQIISTQGSASSGLQGAPNPPRATEVRGLLKVYHFNIEQDALNPMPGLDGPLTSGDLVCIALLDPTDRVYYGRVRNNDWGGTLTQFTVGKYDPNTGIYSVGYYLSTTALTPAGDTQFTTSIGKQVGADPLGDQSTGNMIPGFGSEKIQIVIALSGTFDTGGTIEGEIFFVEEGN